MTDLFLVVGVDPGLDGAICVLVCDPALNLAHRPILKRLRDDPLVAPSIAAVLHAFSKHDDWGLIAGSVAVAGVFVEKASTRPRQGIQQAFNYGAGWGIIQGAIRQAGHPLTLVPPAVWSKVMHAGTRVWMKPPNKEDGLCGIDTKARSFEACRQLFPETSLIPEGGKTPNDGLAEALLIAEHGRRVLKGAQR